MEQGRLGEELVRLPLGSGHRLQQEDAQVLRVPLRKRRRLEVEHRPPCRGRGGRSVRIRRLRRVRRLLARGLDRDRRPRSARREVPPRAIRRLRRRKPQVGPRLPELHRPVRLLRRGGEALDVVRLVVGRNLHARARRADRTPRPPREVSGERTLGPVLRQEDRGRVLRLDGTGSSSRTGSSRQGADTTFASSGRRAPTDPTSTRTARRPSTTSTR